MNKRGQSSIIVLATMLIVCILGLAACSSGVSGSSASGAASTASSATNATSASSAANTSSATETTITDMLGREVDVPANPQRIIGIGSSSLRLISYLQAIDKVVGVEQSEQEDSVTCTYRHVNHELFAQLPVIGEGGSKGVTPNEEAIIGVSPDLIIASVDKDTADALQAKVNAPVVCITLSDIVFDEVFYDNVKMVGEVLGKQQRASSIVTYMKDIEVDLTARTVNAQTKSAYAAGISYRGGHGFAGTEAGFAPFSINNVVNIADEGVAPGCFDIDLEQVSAAQPDFIFVESGNIGLVKEDVENNPVYFENLEAVKNGNVYSLVSYRFYATNTDLALANCYQVGCAVYPDQFNGIDPTQKLDEISEFFLGAPLSEDLAEAGCAFQKYDLMSL